MTINWLTEAESQKDHTIALRRDFHRHPELGFLEHRTAKIVTNELKDLGLDVKPAIAETGVVARLEGTHPGKTIMLRFDMDALPVQEETNVDYASETPGVMHACGHDGHIAIGLTVAKILSQHKEEFKGRVMFVFQPSEEGITGEYGAQRMLAEGIFKHLKPERMLAFHLWNSMPLGWIAITPGPMMASLDLFRIKVFGKGGHAAAPQGNIDPILAASQLVPAMQSITSRNVPPVESAVVSVTMLKGGESPNVTPSLVTIEGTLRTFKPQIRDLVIERMKTLADGIAAGLGCTADVKVYGSNPAVVNDPHAAQVCQLVTASLFPDWGIDIDYQTMLSEDCAFFLEKVTGCFMLLGSANAEKGLTQPHHSAKFDFDEDILPMASALLADATCHLLNL